MRYGPVQLQYSLLSLIRSFVAFPCSPSSSFCVRIGGFSSSNWFRLRTNVVSPGTRRFPSWHSFRSSTVYGNVEFSNNEFLRRACTEREILPITSMAAASRDMQTPQTVPTAPAAEQEADKRRSSSRLKPKQAILGANFAVLAATTVVIVPALCVWMMQPLYAARANMASQQLFASEDLFWHIAADGSRVKSEQFPLPLDPPTKILSVVVPAYNEEERLPGMLETTLEYLEDRHQQDSSFTFEVIVVSDGSTDGTADAVERWSRELGADTVRLLELEVNQGKGAAVRKGMLRMRGEYGLMVDGDAATEISDLDRLFVRMKEVELTGTSSAKGSPRTHGMVVGSRAHMEGEAVAKRSWHRTLLMYVFHWCVSLLCTRQIRDTQCGFKLFTRDTAISIFGSLHLHRWAFDTELVYLCQLLGIPMAEVPVNWREVEGSKLIRSKLDIVTTSATMLRDMLCVKMCYLLGIWKVTPTPAGLIRSATGNSDSEGTNGR